MIEAYRIMNGFNRVDKEKWFQFRDPATTRTTRNTASVSEEGMEMRANVLFPCNVNTEIRRNFFTVRVISKWNALPDAVKGQKTINAFKLHYDRWKENAKEKEKKTQNS